jgi:hypothetical protein
MAAESDETTEEGVAEGEGGMQRRGGVGGGNGMVNEEGIMRSEGVSRGKEMTSTTREPPRGFLYALLGERLGDSGVELDLERCSMVILKSSNDLRV